MICFTMIINTLVTLQCPDFLCAVGFRNEEIKERNDENSKLKLEDKNCDTSGQRYEQLCVSHKNMFGCQGVCKPRGTVKTQQTSDFRLSL